MFNIKNMYVLFWFRKSEAKGEILNRKKNHLHDTIGNVCCRITISTQIIEIGSVHINLRRSDWNEAAQCLNGRDETSRKHNRKLTEIKAKLERTYELLLLDNEDVEPVTVKMHFLGKRLFRYSFNQLIVEYLKDRNEEKKAGMVSQQTIDVHRNYGRNFELFLANKGLQSMLPANFDEDNLDTFKIYLLTQKFAPSHCRKHLGWVKQLLKHSLRKKRIKQNLLTGIRVPKEDTEPDTTHLTIEQLQHLLNYDFSTLVSLGYIHQDTALRLDRERDAFVFSAFTGMHHCDYTSRKYWLEDFKNDVFLKGRRKKTKKIFSLKLLEPALQILQKYGGKIENLPVKSNQKRNATLKELSTICKIPILLSTKIARKTFADMALNVLMLDEGDVAACLGLTSTKSLCHYTRIRDERIAKKMGSWDIIINRAAA